MQPGSVDGGRRVVVVDAGKSTLRIGLYEGLRLIGRSRTERGLPHPNEPGAGPSIVASLAAALVQVADPPYDLLVVAATGIRGSGPAESRLHRVLTEAFGCPVRLCNDVTAAYLGAHGTEPGVIAVAGTGALVLAVDETDAVRLDGWGHLAGDRGSGFDLGRRGVRAALAAVDGTAAPTSLKSLIDADPERFIADLYASPSPVPTVAGFAREVCAAAAVGDAVAVALVTEVATELAETTRTAAARVGDAELTRLPVALAGGLADDPLYRAAFTAALRIGRPAARLITARGDALVGAHVLATDPDHPICRRLLTRDGADVAAAPEVRP